MNKVYIAGNLTKDPTLNTTQNGKNVTAFTVASNHSYTANGEQKESATFINCVAWGWLADAAYTLKKGENVCLHGRLQTRSYEAKDGTKRYVTEVIVDGLYSKVQPPKDEDSAFATFGGGDENVPF